MTSAELAKHFGEQLARTMRAHGFVLVVADEHGSLGFATNVPADVAERLLADLLQSNAMSGRPA
jgi:hypothetical protein